MGYKVFEKGFFGQGSKRPTIQGQLGTSYMGPYDPSKGLIL